MIHKDGCSVVAVICDSAFELGDAYWRRGFYLVYREIGSRGIQMFYLIIVLCSLGYLRTFGHGAI